MIEIDIIGYGQLSVTGEIQVFGLEKSFPLYFRYCNIIRYVFDTNDAMVTI